MSTFTVSGKILESLGKEFSKFRQKSLFKGNHQVFAFSFLSSNIPPTQQQLKVTSVAFLLPTLNPKSSLFFLRYGIR